MTAQSKTFGITLETSNRMSGARCSLVLCFFMLFLNLQSVRTVNVLRSKRLTEEDVCKETSKTITPLQSFPENYTILQERIQQKKCDIFPKCNGELLVYHCVRYKDDIVEVCAPKRLIKGNYCVVFDGGIGRVIEDFSRPCSECPFKYQSADAINYSSCMKTGKLQISSPKSKNASSTISTNTIEITGIPCCYGTRCKRTAEGCTKHKSTSDVMIANENHPTSGEEENRFPWFYFVLIASIIVIGLIALFFIALYRKRQKGTNGGIEKEKEQIGHNLSADEKISNDTNESVIHNVESELLNDG